MQVEVQTISDLISNEVEHKPCSIVILTINFIVITFKDNDGYFILCNELTAIRINESDSEMQKTHNKGISSILFIVSKILS